MHFFEAIRREINFTSEYLKIENIIIKESMQTDSRHYQTINRWIEEGFRSWKRRDTFLSLNELRSHLGFICVSPQGGIDKESIPDTVSMEQYFLYCEMIINLAYDLNGINSAYLSEIFITIIETMRLNIERSGFELKMVNEGIIVVEKNAAAIEAADLLPDLADIIVEYNHYLLRGNLGRKKEILRIIADAFEPERNLYEALCKQETSDFFFMVNNMNIRHNNCDPKDPGKYRKDFAVLSEAEKERWYDRIYEQALFMTIKRNQNERSQIIKDFRQNMGTN